MGRLLQIALSNRDAILAVLQRYGATEPRIFGSALRDDETPASDLDLLVCMPTSVSLLNVVRLERELEELLAHDVDLVIEDELHPRIGAQVLREARPL